MRVKALSFRQPWAELVLSGQKSLDLRTWHTRYRGPLAIYAPQTIEREACEAYGLDPADLPTGAIVGLVDLVRVVELDEALYAERSDEHLNARRFRQPLFGWELASPQRLAMPQPAHGRHRLFEVDLDMPGDAVPVATAADDAEEGPAASAPGAAWDSSLPFELRVVPATGRADAQAGYRLALHQRIVEAPSAQPDLYGPSPAQMQRLVELGGTALRAVADHVIQALRDNGYRATDLGPGRREPFVLEEEWGVRLGLLFLAVRPIAKVARIEAISRGIRDMTGEELYYWFSLCTNRTSGQRGQKALRVLLAEE